LFLFKNKKIPMAQPPAASVTIRVIQNVLQRLPRLFIFLFRFFLLISQLFLLISNTAIPRLQSVDRHLLSNWFDLSKKGAADAAPFYLRPVREAL
jgi:hypothetical protein